MQQNITRVLTTLALGAAMIFAQDAAAYRSQGEAQLRSGQYQKAVDAYSQAVRLNPADAESYTGLGAAYGKLGKSKESAEAYEKSAEAFQKRAAGGVPVPATPALDPPPLAKANAPRPGGNPPAGVYGCYSARPTYGALGCVKTSVGCLGMQIQVAATVMFDLIDGSTYSDYDGKKGHYTYNAGTEILTMTDGSRQGWSYKRVATWSFQMLDPQGKEAAYTCPLDPKKDPSKRPW